MVCDHLEVEPMVGGEVQDGEGDKDKQDYHQAPLQPHAPVADEEIEGGSDWPCQGGLLGVEGEGEDGRACDEPGPGEGRRTKDEGRRRSWECWGACIGCGRATAYGDCGEACGG